MKITQFLLLKLAEEAQEVAHRALKAAQFGYNDTEPGRLTSNRALLHTELDDFSGIIRMLENVKCQQLGYQPDPDAIAYKAEKVLKYARYSHSCGQLPKDTLERLEKLVERTNP